MTDAGTRRPRRPSPPEVPDDYLLSFQYRTGPESAIVAVEVWGRPRRRDALIRVIDDAGSMDAGTAVALGTAEATVDWTDEARIECGEDWLAAQRRVIVRHFAARWGD